MHIATQLVKSEKEADTIFSLLDNSDLSEFDREQSEKIKYELIRKMKGDHEADKFLTQNISNPELRRTAISKAIEDKNFEKAVSLANDGIKCDTEDKPGLALEWYDWLLRIALIQKDTTNIIGYALFLFVDGFWNDLDYYDSMKKLGARKRVNNLVEKLRKEYPQRRALMEELDLI